MTNQSTTTKEALEPLPRWTVTYNIVSPESNAWVGTGWEFFNDEREADACYRRHRDLGNVPTKRSFYDSVDREHLGVADRARISAPVAPVVDDLLRDAGAVYIVNDVIAGAQVVIRFSELKDAQRLHKALAESRAPASTVAPQQSDELAEVTRERDALRAENKRVYTPSIVEGLKLLEDAGFSKETPNSLSCMIQKALAQLERYRQENGELRAQLSGTKNL